MSSVVLDLELPSLGDTERFAQNLASCLRSGDTLLLRGDIGAGKTYLARHIILSLLDTPEDIPSPTFTLIQSYDTRLGDVLHADLYRLSGPDEIVELGLLDAFGKSLCLVEWPDRLGDDAPQDALNIHLKTHQANETRTLSATGKADRWQDRLNGLSND